MLFFELLNHLYVTAPKDELAAIVNVVAVDPIHKDCLVIEGCEVIVNGSVILIELEKLEAQVPLEYFTL